MLGIKWVACPLRQCAEQLDKGHQEFTELLNTQGLMPLDPFCWHHFSFFVCFFFWKTKLFCLRRSTFYGAFDDSSVEAGVAAFPFQGPNPHREVPCPCFLSPGPVSTRRLLRFIVDTSAEVGGGVWPPRNLVERKRGRLRGHILELEDRARSYL